MKTVIALLSAALFIAGNACAATAAKKSPAPAGKKTAATAERKYVVVDHSNELLLDKGAAKAAWAEPVPAKVMKLYPPKRWGFLTEVEGGFIAGNTCVASARVMLLPLGVNGRTLLFKPEKTTSTFDSLPTATREQCVEVARGKLKEAIHAMIVALGG